jgi:hypothetical protein
MVELSTTKRPKDELAFVNHIFEFVRFYNNHRLFCDQISGLKGKQVTSAQSEIQVYITEKNFILAIRKLNAFVIDNMHYIKDISDSVTIQFQISDLENRFLNDKLFIELVAKEYRYSDDETLLQKKYFEYLLSCFEIESKLLRLLQSSLMVSPSEIKKYVSYHNPTQFFENISYYREEVSNDISQFRLSDTLKHIKKILGYIYSYKILLKEEEILLIEELQRMLILYVLDEKTLENVKKASQELIPSDEMVLLSEDSRRIRRMIEYLYLLTNKCLAERNIFPKIQRKIFIDKTTI